MALMVFDIETIPDIKSGAILHNLEGLSDSSIIDGLYAINRAKTGSEFLPHHLHQIVAISVVVSTDNWVKVWSLGEEDSSEKDILVRFFAGLDKYTPTLVSWNGTGFDLPVIHYRSMLNKVQAQKYWESGERDPNFKWNNYLNRFHSRHTDLMDVLSGYTGRAVAKLDDISKILGFPGKMGVDGSDVLSYYQNGDIKTIRDYCETDVLNTYLVYLRYQLIRGVFSEEQYDILIKQLKRTLEDTKEQHLHLFSEAIND